MTGDAPVELHDDIVVERLRAIAVLAHGGPVRHPLLKAIAAAADCAVGQATGDGLDAVTRGEMEATARGAAAAQIIGTECDPTAELEARLVGIVGMATLPTAIHPILEAIGTIADSALSTHGLGRYGERG